MEREKTVFFTGHRKIAKSLRADLLQDLYSAVCRFILEGYEVFICGGAIGFDTMAAECVLSFKKRFPQIKLVLALPCRDQTVKWDSVEDLARYKNILSQADSVEYINDFYKKGCMHERNRWMADRSALCIAYLTTVRGGTAYTYKYAEEKGLRLLNLANGEEKEQLSFC